MLPDVNADVSHLADQMSPIFCACSTSVRNFWAELLLGLEASSLGGEWEKIKTCKSRQKFECGSTIHSVKEVCRTLACCFRVLRFVDHLVLSVP